jgi:hypothetical protein
MSTITSSEAAKAVVRRNTEGIQRKGRFDAFEELLMRVAVRSLSKFGDFIFGGDGNDGRGRQEVGGHAARA